MTGSARQTGGQRGSAMLAAVYCVFVVSMAVTGMAALMGHDTHQGRRLEKRTQAALIAEGAAEYAIARIAADFSRLYSPTGDMLAGQMGQGSYRNELVQTGEDIYCLAATGTVGEVSFTIKAHLQVCDPYLVFRKAIFSDNSIDGGGNGQIVNSTHSNRNTTYYGNCRVDGRVDSVGVSTVQGNSQVTGEVASNMPALMFPTLDLGYYYNVAAANGQVYSGDKSLKGNYAPAGGVMWVDGDVSIKAKTTFAGCLIATGTITQTGTFTQTQVEDFPALVSRDGDIGLWGGTVLNGVVYTKSGFVNIHGGTHLHGSIVSWGGVNLNGNWGVIDHKEERPEVEETQRVSLLAWES